MLITRARGSANDKKKRFVLVIGGGQSGLAAGYYLKQAGIPYLILEKKRSSWRYLAKSIYLADTVYAPIS